MENINETVSQIEAIIKKALEGTKIVFQVEPYQMAFGGEAIKIWMACSTKLINGVRGQMPQVVSLILIGDDLELRPQIFGGMGGQCIYREVNKDDPKERFYAMQRIKIPFKQPKKEMKFVLSAIERFTQNYVKALIDNKEKLMHKDLVNYDEVLGFTM